MRLAQLIGATVPIRPVQGLKQPRRIGLRIRIADPQQSIRRFRFGGSEVSGAIEP